ncbi:MAG: hydrogenase maturation protease [Magnetospirillum sp.]|nr:hydrogenase maturation protease [Magnetospirillum sp.]
MRTRIICIGNALIPEDDAGPRVFERLRRARLPATVELVDGGLAGLRLLPLFEDGRRIVLVDAVSGLAEAGTVTVFDCASVVGGSAGANYGHAGGLAYLLGVLPAVIDGPIPQILLVGLETPAGGEAIEAAADLCLNLDEREPHHVVQPFPH